MANRKFYNEDVKIKAKIEADNNEELAAFARCILGDNCEFFDQDFDGAADEKTIDVPAAEFGYEDEEDKVAEVPENPFDVDFEIKAETEEEDEDDEEEESEEDEVFPNPEKNHLVDTYKDVDIYDCTCGKFVAMIDGKKVKKETVDELKKCIDGECEEELEEDVIAVDAPKDGKPVKMPNEQPGQPKKKTCEKCGKEIKECKKLKESEDPDAAMKKAMPAIDKYAKKNKLNVAFTKPAGGNAYNLLDPDKKSLGCVKVDPKTGRVVPCNKLKEQQEFDDFDTQIQSDELVPANYAPDYDPELEDNLGVEVDPDDLSEEEFLRLFGEAMAKRQCRRINEATDKEFKAILALCKELGIKTAGDLERFSRENPGKLLAVLKKYRAELGPDFKINEMTQEDIEEYAAEFDKNHPNKDLPMAMSATEAMQQLLSWTKKR